MDDAEYLINKFDEDVPELQDFLKEFLDETDRAMAVLGTAYLESKIGESLVTYFGEDKSEARDLVNGKLRSYDIRCRLAYCLDMLHDTEFADLQTIGQIRNKFAHRVHGLSFSSPKVVEKCETLRFHEYVVRSVDFEGEVDSRMKFALSVWALVIAAIARTHNIRRGGREAGHRDWVARVAKSRAQE